MSGNSQQQSTEIDAARVAAELRTAIAQFAAASDRVGNLISDAQSLLAKMGHVSAANLQVSGSEVVPEVAEQALVPHWDRDRRVLCVGQHVVKRYRVPSPNQEIILAAFQEEGWPPSVDDPLPPVADYCPKQRLHDTIKSLNARQERTLIRFHGDGTGKRIIFELIAPQPVNINAAVKRLRRAA